jgi:GxxExxY protein
MHPGSSPGQAAEHADGDRLNDLSGRVIGCAFTVLNTLGAGFLEKVYESALALELRAAGLAVVQQCSARVYYNGVVVGEYFADLLVDDLLLVELKTVKALNDVHMPPGF